MSAMARPFSFQNTVIAVVQPGSNRIESLTDAFDEDASLVAWKANGIFFAASQRTWAHLFRLNPQTKAIARHAGRDNWIASGFSLSADGTRVAYIGSGPGGLSGCLCGLTRGSRRRRIRLPRGRSTRVR